MPSDRSPLELQRLSTLIPLSLRADMQAIADRRFLSLSDVIREACAEYTAREKRDEGFAGAR